MSVVAKEQAQKEVNQWLDAIDVSASQKEARASAIQKIINAVESGAVVINPETQVLTQKLKRPVGEDTTELKFKPEITVGDVQKFLDDDNGRYSVVFAHISASTGEPSDVIKKLYVKDYNLADAIIIFFMV